MKYRPEKTEGGWQQAAVADAQDEIKAIIAKCVAEGMPFDRFMKMVSDEIDELVDDIGSSLTGREAVEEGLCHQVGGLQDALRALYEMMEEMPHGS